MTHTVSLLWALCEFATNTVSLLWPIHEIITMGSPCSGSSVLTLSWSPVSSLCLLIVISQWCHWFYLILWVLGELTVSMVLARTFTGSVIHYRISSNIKMRYFKSTIVFFFLNFNRTICMGDKSSASQWCDSSAPPSSTARRTSYVIGSPQRNI